MAARGTIAQVQSRAGSPMMTKPHLLACVMLAMLLGAAPVAADDDTTRYIEVVGTGEADAAPDAQAAP